MSATEEVETKVEEPTNEKTTTTATKSERKVRSAARLQRKATEAGVRSAGDARKAMIEAVKKRDYSIEIMDKLWQQAIAIAKDAGKKTVQKKDVERVLNVIDTMESLK